MYDLVNVTRNAQAREIPEACRHVGRLQRDTAAILVGQLGGILEVQGQHCQKGSQHRRRAFHQDDVPQPHHSEKGPSAGGEREKMVCGQEMKGHAKLVELHVHLRQQVANEGTQDCDIAEESLETRPVVSGANLLCDVAQTCKDSLLAEAEEQRHRSQEAHALAVPDLWPAPSTSPQHSAQYRPLLRAQVLGQSSRQVAIDLPGTLLLQLVLQILHLFNLWTWAPPTWPEEMSVTQRSSSVNQELHLLLQHLVCFPLIQQQCPSLMHGFVL
mmetsp:Transcript_170572/g.547120  ORF Transcript_170572/g.547120 Transcript_170572/m.547120 type:complete len:271 (-) Transcript_170572:1198-2010(-)